MKRSLEYLFGVISFGLLLALFLPSIAMRVHAADPGSFEIFPKASSVNEAGNNIYGQYVEELGKNKKADFWKVYNDRADEFSNSKDIWSQFASWIMNRDTIFLFLAQIVRVLSNMALVIGSAMIIYAGYLYISSVYTGDNAAKANEAIKRAIIGIIVVIFSYAIIRILVSAFL